MGTVGREIVGEEVVGGIIDDLNQAIAAEIGDEDEIERRLAGWPTT